MNNQTTCCEKCRWSINNDHRVINHTIRRDCVNLDCPCHKETKECTHIRCLNCEEENANTPKETSWEERFDKLMSKRTIGSLIDQGESGKVFVDGEFKLEMGRVKSFITQLLKREKQKLLEDYSDWLHKKGYIDADYYTEEPKAVEQYLKEISDE